MDVQGSQILVLVIVFAGAVALVWWEARDNKRLLKKRRHRNRMRGKLHVIVGGRKDP